MASVIVNDTVLSNIANAIREKNGAITKYRPRDMASAILAITGGGGGSIPEEIPDEALNITKGSYRFVNNQWTWFIDAYGAEITTTDIGDCVYMFGTTDDSVSDILNIPFAINYKTGSYAGYDATCMFKNCYKLKALPELNGFEPVKLTGFSSGCYQLKDISSLLDVNFSYLHNGESNLAQMFRNCYALREIPAELIKELYVKTTPTNTLATRSFFNQGFAYCISLDELVGLVVDTSGYTIENNLFYSAFERCGRLKEVKFAKSATGYTPSVMWKNQYIDLSTVGVTDSADVNNLKNYGGFTEDTRITDGASYLALKDNPDSWTTDAAYSRYNRTSAYNTICTLPDAIRGSNNTIRFRQSAGSLTDGGAIGSLTQEQIAAATAKGWTVAFTNN